MSRPFSASSRSNNLKGSRAEGPDRRQRRSAETRERMFRAALRLFAEKGFAETTVEDITNAADIGKGTFFNYFPSKEHILIAFSDMQLSKFQAAVDQMRERREPMRSFLRTMTLRMTEEPSEVPRVIRAMLQANLSSARSRSVMREQVRERSITYKIGANRPGARRNSGGMCLRCEIGAGISSDHIRDAADVVALR